MKKLSKSETKRIEAYLKKARDYIYQLEEKYDTELEVDYETACEMENSAAVIVHLINNSKL